MDNADVLQALLPLLSNTRHICQLEEADRAQFWRLVDVSNLQFITYLDDDEVDVYWGMKMMAVKGRLFRMDLPRESWLPELERSIARASRWVVRRAGLDEYTLKFNAGRMQICVTLRKWDRRLRTCQTWLVYLQRRVRRWISARRHLAVAMALHGRLGRRSALAALGEDLLAEICCVEADAADNMQCPFKPGELCWALWPS